MAKSAIRVNADAFIKSLDQQQLIRHQGIMVSLQKYVDRALESAYTKHIIKGKFRSGSMKPGRMYRLQPSDPTRLTSRTGLLYYMLSINAGWNPSKPTKIQGETRLRSHPAIKAWVRPQQSGTSFFYLIRLTMSGDTDVENRIRNEKTGDRRGVRRPFLRPGLEDAYRPAEVDLRWWQQRKYSA